VREVVAIAGPGEEYAAFLTGVNTDAAAAESAAPVPARLRKRIDEDAVRLADCERTLQQTRDSHAAELAHARSDQSKLPQKPVFTLRKRRVHERSWTQS
jgi:hypothetical protein